MSFPKIKKAVIPAAGLGTRFLPASKVIPKELLPIVDRPAIQYIVEEAIEAGIEEIIFVISAGKESVLQHFQHHPALEAALTKKGDTKKLADISTLCDKAKFSCVYQDKPRGLGHAVLCAKEAIGDENFFVFLPDDLVDHEVPCAVQMTRSFASHGQAMVAVMEVPWEDVSKYGVVKALPTSAGLGKLESVIEKPKREDAPSNLVIIGRYLLPPSIFSYLEKVTPGAIGEIQLTDAILELVKNDGAYAFQFEGTRFDTGNKLGYVEANLNYALQDPDIGDKVKELIKLYGESR